MDKQVAVNNGTFDLPSEFENNTTKTLENNPENVIKIEKQTLKNCVNGERNKTVFCNSCLESKTKSDTFTDKVKGGSHMQDKNLISNDINYSKLPPSPWSFAVNYAKNFDYQTTSEYTQSITPKFLFSDDAQLHILEKHLAKLQEQMENTQRKRALAKMNKAQCSRKRKRQNLDLWRAPTLRLECGSSGSESSVNSDSSRNSYSPRSRRFKPNVPSSLVRSQSDNVKNDNVRQRQVLENMEISSNKAQVSHIPVKCEKPLVASNTNETKGPEDGLKDQSPNSDPEEIRDLSQTRNNTNNVSSGAVDCEAMDSVTSTVTDTVRSEKEQILDAQVSTKEDVVRSKVLPTPQALEVSSKSAKVSKIPKLDMKKMQPAKPKKGFVAMVKSAFTGSKDGLDNVSSQQKETKQKSQEKISLFCLENCVMGNKYTETGPFMVGTEPGAEDITSLQNDTSDEDKDSGMKHGIHLNDTTPPSEQTTQPFEYTLYEQGVNEDETVPLELAIDKPIAELRSGDVEYTTATPYMQPVNHNSSAEIYEIGSLERKVTFSSNDELIPTDSYDEEDEFSEIDDIMSILSQEIDQLNQAAKDFETSDAPYDEFSGRSALSDEVFDAVLVDDEVPVSQIVSQKAVLDLDNCGEAILLDINESFQIKEGITRKIAVSDVSDSKELRDDDVDIGMATTDGNDCAGLLVTDFPVVNQHELEIQGPQLDTGLDSKSDDIYSKSKEEDKDASVKESGSGNLSTDGIPRESQSCNDNEIFTCDEETPFSPGELGVTEITHIQQETTYNAREPLDQEQDTFYGQGAELQKKNENVKSKLEMEEDTQREGLLNKKQDEWSSTDAMCEDLEEEDESSSEFEEVDLCNLESSGMADDQLSTDDGNVPIYYTTEPQTYQDVNEGIIRPIEDYEYDSMNYGSMNPDQLSVILEEPSDSASSDLLQDELREHVWEVNFENETIFVDFCSSIRKTDEPISYAPCFKRQSAVELHKVVSSTVITELNKSLTEETCVITRNITRYEETNVLRPLMQADLQVSVNVYGGEFFIDSIEEIVAVYNSSLVYFDENFVKYVNNPYEHYPNITQTEDEMCLANELTSKIQTKDEGSKINEGVNNPGIVDYDLPSISDRPIATSSSVEIVSKIPKAVKSQSNGANENSSVSETNQVIEVPSQVAGNAKVGSPRSGVKDERQSQAPNMIEVEFKPREVPTLTQVTLDFILANLSTDHASISQTDMTTDLDDIFSDPPGINLDMNYASDPPPVITTDTDDNCLYPTNLNLNTVEEHANTVQCKLATDVDEDGGNLSNSKKDHTEIEAKPNFQQNEDKTLKLGKDADNVTRNTGDVTGNRSAVIGNTSDVTGNTSDFTGNSSDVTGNTSDAAETDKVLAMSDKPEVNSSKVVTFAENTKDREPTKKTKIRTNKRIIAKNRTLKKMMEQNKVSEKMEKITSKKDTPKRETVKVDSKKAINQKGIAKSRILKPIKGATQKVETKENPTPFNECPKILTRQDSIETGDMPDPVNSCKEKILVVAETSSGPIDVPVFTKVDAVVDSNVIEITTTEGENNKECEISSKIQKPSNLCCETMDAFEKVIVTSFKKPDQEVWPPQGVQNPIEDPISTSHLQIEKESKFLDQQIVSASQLARSVMEPEFTLSVPDSESAPVSPHKRRTFHNKSDPWPHLSDNKDDAARRYSYGDVRVTTPGKRRTNLHVTQVKKFEPILKPNKPDRPKIVYVFGQRLEIPKESVSVRRAISLSSHDTSKTESPTASEIRPKALSFNSGKERKTVVKRKPRISKSSDPKSPVKPDSPVDQKKTDEKDDPDKQSLKPPIGSSTQSVKRASSFQIPQKKDKVVQAKPKAHSFNSTRDVNTIVKDISKDITKPSTDARQPGDARIARKDSNSKPKPSRILKRATSLTTEGENRKKLGAKPKHHSFNSSTDLITSDENGSKDRTLSKDRNQRSRAKKTESVKVPWQRVSKVTPKVKSEKQDENKPDNASSTEKLIKRPEIGKRRLHVKSKVNESAASSEKESVDENKQDDASSTEKLIKRPEIGKRRLHVKSKVNESAASSEKESVDENKQDEASSTEKLIKRPEIGKRRLHAKPMVSESAPSSEKESVWSTAQSIRSKLSSKNEHNKSTDHLSLSKSEVKQRVTNRSGKPKVKRNETKTTSPKEKNPLKGREKRTIEKSSVAPSEKLTTPIVSNATRETDAQILIHQEIGKKIINTNEFALKHSVENESNAQSRKLPSDESVTSNDIERNDEKSPVHVPAFESVELGRIMQQEQSIGGSPKNDELKDNNKKATCDDETKERPPASDDSQSKVQMLPSCVEVCKEENTDTADDSKESTEDQITISPEVQQREVTDPLKSDTADVSKESTVDQITIPPEVQHREVTDPLKSDTADVSKESTEDQITIPPEVQQREVTDPLEPENNSLDQTFPDSHNQESNETSSTVARTVLPMVEQTDTDNASNTSIDESQNSELTGITQMDQVVKPKRGMKLTLDSTTALNPSQPSNTKSADVDAPLVWQSELTHLQCLQIEARLWNRMDAPGGFDSVSEPLDTNLDSCLSESQMALNELGDDICNDDDVFQEDDSHLQSQAMAMPLKDYNGEIDHSGETELDKTHTDIYVKENQENDVILQELESLNQAIDFEINKGNSITTSEEENTETSLRETDSHDEQKQVDAIDETLMETESTSTNVENNRNEIDGSSSNEGSGEIYEDAYETSQPMDCTSSGNELAPEQDSPAINQETYSSIEEKSCGAEAGQQANNSTCDEIEKSEGQASTQENDDNEYDWEEISKNAQMLASYHDSFDELERECEEEAQHEEEIMNQFLQEYEQLKDHDFDMEEILAPDGEQPSMETLSQDSKQECVDDDEVSLAEKCTDLKEEKIVSCSEKGGFVGSDVVSNEEQSDANPLEKKIIEGDNLENKDGKLKLGKIKDRHRLIPKLQKVLKHSDKAAANAESSKTKKTSETSGSSSKGGSFGFKSRIKQLALPKRVAKDHDDTDFAKPVGIPKQSKRISSAPSSNMARKSSFSGGASKSSAIATPTQTKPTTHLHTPKPAIGSASAALRPGRSASASRVRSRSQTRTQGGAGAVREDAFITAFEDVPKMHIFSGREVVEQITKIKEILQNDKADWQKRCESLKAIRSLLIAGATDHDEFYQLLRTLETSVQLSVKDLRSQIVREACITIGFMSQVLGNKFDHFAECVLPGLIGQIANSAKIMATSATTAISFVLKNTHAPRLIPIILSNLTTKASIIRRELFEQLTTVLALWGKHSLEKHIAALQETIKKGVSDADSEARALARKAYWGFHAHFPNQAASLLDSLDSQKQKLLQGEVSHSSSNSSIGASAGHSSSASRVKSAPGKTRTRSHDRTEMLLGASSSGGARRSLLPSNKSSQHSDTTDGRGYSAQRSANHIKRSSSAVDLASNGHQGGGTMHMRQQTHTGPSRLHTVRTQPSSSSSAYNSLRVRGRRGMRYGSYTDHESSSDYEDSVEWKRDVFRARKYSAPDTSFQTAAFRGRHVRSSTGGSSSSGNSDLMGRSQDESALRRVLSPTYDTRGGAGSYYCTPGYNGPYGYKPPLLRQANVSQNTSLTDSRPKKYGIGVTSSTAGSAERSRTRSKIGVSQSQPSSRSSSPSSRYSYITHQQHHGGESSSTATPAARRSGIPRSQGASRETSPSRYGGRERKHSGLTQGALRLHQKAVGGGGREVLAQRVLVPSSAAEQALADALHPGTGRKRYDTYESDDNMSETSSVCSERSFSSYSRATEKRKRRSSKTNKDVQEILHNLSSGSWAERKEGLIQLKILLRNGRTLNPNELKKIQEVFTRMFHDPHGKVFSIFLETLQDLLSVHRADLHDWLYTCLTRLLQKMGSDMLGSVQAKVQRALEGVRDSFAYDHQFRCITKFIVDSAQSTNIKVKVAVLNYLHGLAGLMEAEDFINTSDTRLSVSRIITWTTEPKSVDVRKAAQAVLIALFNLNTPEFSMLLSALPKTFQEGATKILHNHVRTTSTDHEPLTPRNISMPRYRPSPNRARHVEDGDTENMNPEDIQHSFKTLQADIQSLAKLDHGGSEDLKKERDTTSQDSGIQGSLQDIRDNKESPRGHRQYNPTHYQENQRNVNGYNKAAMQDAVFDVDTFNDAPLKNLLGYSTSNQHHSSPQNNRFPSSDVVTEILSELSNHNERQEERKNAMLNLIKLTREGAVDVWDEHFKTILLLLLETLGGDTDAQVRALALRVLREILRNQPTRFRDYAELTILKILEAHRDSEREVARAAEECAVTLAHSIAPEQCINVLVPILQTAEYPVSLAAIKMLTKVLENISKDVLKKHLTTVVPGLLKCYDDSQSSVRKASVFCLVATYNVVGEDLRPHINELNGSKMKLLNLYIKRSATQSSDQDSASTSKTTSPTTSTLTAFS